MLLSSGAMASSGDVQKEQRIAEQTLQTLFVGEPVWLNAKQKFLALINEDVSTENSAVNAAESAILLIHGSGQGPDTPFVIAPLRELLAEQGYPTLSIQMPVLAEEGAPYKKYVEKFPDARQRITAAIDYLVGQNKKKITIIAHSMGSTMLMDWIAQEEVGKVSAIVTLGLGSTLKDDVNKSHFDSAFKKINVPFLDAYGENDFESVLKNAPSRVEALKATHPKSQQLAMSGADHFYANAEEMLVQLLVKWLQDNP
jgi:pimeloyl-ACP methyl ester carboxylesterase